MTKSIWVGREIQKSIEENNKFVLIDISSGQYDKDFLSQYKIGSKSLDEIYPIHSVENCNKKKVLLMLENGCVMQLLIYSLPYLIYG